MRKWHYLCEIGEASQNKKYRDVKCCLLIFEVKFYEW